MRPLVLAGALLASLPLLSQAQQMPQLGETIDVSVVNVDVFVTDKRGVRIFGLGQNDFQVYENGVLQPITNFSEYRGEPASTSAALTGDEKAVALRPQRRTVIVFVDDLHLPKSNSDAFFRSLKTLLRKAIRGGDAAMIVSWRADRETVMQAMTDDTAALEGALDRIAVWTNAPTVDEQAQAKVDADIGRQFDMQVAADNREVVSNPLSRGEFAQPSWAADMEGRGRTKKAQADQNRKVEALRTLMRAVAGDEGRKLMILATHRLSSFPGAEFVFAAGTSPLALGETRTEMSAAQQLRSLYEAANADGITLYTLYPEGMREPISDATLGSDGRTSSPTGDATGSAQLSDDQIAFAVSSNETGALRVISDHTGGRSASGQDSANLLVAVQDDLDSYYSLGYRVTPGKADRPRAIVVKTSRDLIIRSRREYVAKSEVTRMEDRVIAALYRKPPAAPFQIGVKLDPPQAVARGVVIPVTVRIPMSALTTIPESGEYAGAFSVYLATGAAARLSGKTSHVTKPFRIPARNLAKAKEGYYSYAIKLLGDRATDRIVFGVVDEVSKEYAISTLSFDLHLR